MTTATIDTCPKCQRHMNDGDLVLIDWNGTPTAHINCPDMDKEAAQLLERQA